MDRELPFVYNTIDVDLHLRDFSFFFLEFFHLPVIFESTRILINFRLHLLRNFTHSRDF